MLEKGRIRPEDIIPEIAPFEFYVEAFQELHTCRTGGMGLTPIPFSSIIEYASYIGLDREATDDLLYFIRKMDNKYVSLENKNNGKDNTSSGNPSNDRQQDQIGAKKHPKRS